MKFLRFGPKGQEKPGVLDSDGGIRDISAHTPDFQGDAVSIDALAKLSGVDINGLPLAPEGARIAACLADVPNFFCIGLNYAKHAEETGATPPKEPILFSKASSALSGPFDPVIIPKGSEKGDWEVELGVIIGREASYVSERAFQTERSGQWIKGKSAPTFGPCGPYLVTADEIPDPHALEVELTLNGAVQQSEGTADMIFTVRQIISHVSPFMTLRPGDIFATGTPSGVGPVIKGDVMEVEVAALGTLSVKVT